MSAEHLRLASRTSPVEAAWAAFDTAAIELQRMYRDPSWTQIDNEDARQARMKWAIEVARLWREFMDLFDTVCGGDEPGAAA